MDEQELDFDLPPNVVLDKVGQRRRSVGIQPFPPRRPVHIQLPVRVKHIFLHCDNLAGGKRDAKRIGLSRQQITYASVAALDDLRQM